MNLKDLVNSINAQLDYDPNMANYKRIVRDTINRFYLEVSERHPWTFMQKTGELSLEATISGSSSSTVAVTNGLHTVTFASQVIPSEASGHLFLAPDGAYYEIGLASDSLTMYLDSPYDGSTAAAATSWSVEYYRYPLPADCSEPLSLIDREGDGGTIPIIDARMEELSYLDADDTGETRFFVETDHKADRAPMTIATNSSGVEVVFAASAAGSGTGDLVSGTEYEYCYLFRYRGRSSPPSVVVSATATSTGTISLVGMENTQNAGADTGKSKVIFRRDKTNGGRWLKIDTLTSGGSESTTTYTDDGSDPAVYTYQAENNELNEPPARQYLRPYPRAGEDHSYTLRYLVRPRPMVADSDVPYLWPESCHALLIYLTLQDACLMHGMTSQSAMYEKRAKEVLERMKAKWLSRLDRTYVRQGFDSSRGRGRWGSVTKSDA